MKIAVIGTAQTKFGELWDKSLFDLLAESQLTALENAKIAPQKIDAIFTGNMCSGIFSNQLSLGSLASETLNIHVPSTTIEGACASGGLAIRAGIQAIESQQANIVMINGIEKMTDVNNGQISAGLMAATSSEWEYFQGATFPGLNALIARLYMHEFGLTREQLAAVSVQNHEHALLNPLAHLHKKITIDNVINSIMIADPLTLLDCSPISDGAASLILCNEKVAKQYTSNPVYIIGSGQASDTLCLQYRENLLEWKATRLAGQIAFKQANLKPQDIDVAEIHDGFSIVEIIALEDLGFFPKGKAGLAISEGKTKLNSQLPVNPSGGLKGKGHPVGATGVAQAVEIVQQLQNKCGKRQIKNAKIGLTHNAGGCGSTAVVHIFKKE